MTIDVTQTIKLSYEDANRIAIAHLQSILDSSIMSKCGFMDNYRISKEFDVYKISIYPPTGEEMVTTFEDPLSGSDRDIYKTIKSLETNEPR
jgi:hypothetical protein|tara:strand:+ start:3551 stop:3826 length:276 start_codon:yes stop_codon:yes gene_type:complete